MTGREVIIGVSGGIAAYKSAALVSQLVQQGCGVTVVMTAAARKFVGPATFSALTGRAVHSRLFGDTEFPLGPHVALPTNAELLCVAPATANTLAKAALGLADDLLSTLYLAFRGPVLVAPAMNAQMWEQPAVQRNVAQLRADGVEIVEPGEGWLSCRQRGTGRMAEPDVILRAIQTRLASLPPAENRT